MSRRIRLAAMLAGTAAVVLAAPLAVSQVPATTSPSASGGDSCADLRAEVKQLRAQVARLQQQLDAQRPAPRATAKKPAVLPSVSQSAFPPVCDPPTYVDAGGIRRVRPECMDSLMLDRGPSTDREPASTTEQLLLDRGPSNRVPTGNRDADDLMNYRGPSTAPTPTAAEQNPCAYPVYVDQQGVRHYKRECF